MDEKTHYLFISYAHKDVGPVKRIKLELNKRGFNTWFDEDDIIGGRKWQEEIYRGIDHCAGILLMVTPSAAASEWVGKEWQRAQTRQKSIIPVLLVPTPDNPLPEIQWVDFQNRESDEKFLHATYDLVRAICAVTEYPGCRTILEEIKERLGFARIEEHLDELRRSTISAEKWLNEIDAACGGAVVRWEEAAQPEDEGTTARLVRLAVGSDIPNPQIMLHAARTIGRCGNRPAVVMLAGHLADGLFVPRALSAFSVIWEARSDGIPNRLLGPVWWRVKAYIGWQQFRYPSIVPVLLSTIAAACLGLMVMFYIEFPDPSGTFPLTRMSNVVSNGISYGLFVGGGIALTGFLIPRLRILRRLRFVMGGLAGWLVITLAFIVLNMLFYRRVPADWSNVVQLSFLFSLGYAISALIQPKTLPRTLLRMGIAFAGVLAALAIPCGWSLLPERLFYLSGQCDQKALFLSLLIVVISFLHEIMDHLNQRGGLLQRLRLRLNKPGKKVEALGGS